MIINLIRAVLALILPLILVHPVKAQTQLERDWTTDAETGCKIQVYFREYHVIHTTHWWGACIDGVAEGEGILEWRTQSGRFLARYEGRLRLGKRDGPGLYVHHSGRRDQGEWREDYLFAGTHFISPGGGDSYEAFIVGGKVIRMIVVWPDSDGRPGGRYDGGWADRNPNPSDSGRVGPHGQGTYTSNDGRVHSGIWEYGCLRFGNSTVSLAVPPQECGIK